MSSAPTNLFFYGVLRPDVADWPFLAGLGPGRAATTRGTLHAIPDPNGWYPALTPGDNLIHGVCHEAGSVDLAAVDAFEGADYSRAEVVCEMEGVGGPAIETKADLYLWTAPLPRDAQPIPNGDFARWLAETGNAALSAR